MSSWKSKHRRSGWRGRPPWWPENEPFPPARPPWGKARGTFFMRAAGWFAAMFLFSVFACTITLYLAAGALQSIDLPLGGALAALSAAALFGVLGLAAGAGALRRLARPIGDLLDASGRVAEGDYTVRVEERGAREVRSLARAFNSMAGRLQSEDERRRNLLAEITHELRTPLTVIQGNLEALLDGVYPVDEVHLETILEETRVLSRLMDDLRTLALFESGALQLQRDLTDLGELASDTAAAFRPQADARGVSLEAEVEDLPPAHVDPGRMREVLSNLISNALRFTPAGGTIRVTAARADSGRYVLEVHDTGAGIAAEDLPHVFDRFYKSAESEGSGLGLAIAKNLVEAHGGKIEPMSLPGEGTTMRVLLPPDPETALEA